MSKNWNKAENTYLKRYAETKSVDELAQRFVRTAREVREQLGELGIESKDGGSLASDPVVEAFEKGIAAVNKKKWAQAVSLLESVAGQTDLPGVAARAKQFIKISKAQLNEEPDAGAKDPFLRAVYLKNLGDYEEALALCRSGKRAQDERFVYLAASIHAVCDEHEMAAEVLAKAIELNAENRVHAFHDHDFGDLRKDNEYGHLFGVE